MKEATPKQKAFLCYMQIDSSGMSSIDAKEIMDRLFNHDGDFPQSVYFKLQYWNSDKFFLYPDLYSSPTQDRCFSEFKFKISRPENLRQLGLSYGDPFTRPLTKKMCLAVVEFLDLRFPKWDEEWASNPYPGPSSLNVLWGPCLEAIEIIDVSFIKVSYRPGTKNRFNDPNFNPDQAQSLSNAYTVHRDGENFGPFPKPHIEALIRAGNVVESDQIWSSSSTEWQEASLIFKDTFDEIRA